VELQPPRIRLCAGTLGVLDAVRTASFPELETLEGPTPPARRRIALRRSPRCGHRSSRRPSRGGERARAAGCGASRRARTSRLCPRIVADSTQRVASSESLIVDALSAVLPVLGEAADSPRIGELRARARLYERALRHWTAVAPTSVQLDAMFDLVTDLHGKAADTERRKRI
jgi:hypothetical protein